MDSIFMLYFQLRHELNRLSEDREKYSRTKFTSAKLKKKAEKLDPINLSNVQFNLPPIHNIGKIRLNDRRLMNFCQIRVYMLN